MEITMGNNSCTIEDMPNIMNLRNGEERIIVVKSNGGFEINYGKHMLTIKGGDVYHEDCTMTMMDLIEASKPKDKPFNWVEDFVKTAGLFPIDASKHSVPEKMIGTEIFDMMCANMAKHYSTKCLPETDGMGFMRFLRGESVLEILAVKDFSQDWLHNNDNIKWIVSFRGGDNNPRYVCGLDSCVDDLIHAQLFSSQHNAQACASTREFSRNLGEGFYSIQAVYDGRN